MQEQNFAAGYDELAASLADVKVSDEAKAIADAYMGAKKAMIVYQQNNLTVDAATLIADIALVSGHIGTPRDGVLQVKAKNNSQGLQPLFYRRNSQESGETKLSVRICSAIKE